MLKDASDIVFYNYPNDHTPLPQVPLKNTFTALLQSGCTPVLIVAGSQHSTRTSRPSACVQDANNVSSNTRKHMLSSATDPPPKKATTMHFLSPLDTDEEDKDEGNSPSSPPTQEGSFYEEFVPHPDDNDNDNKAKSGNGDDASQMTQISVPYSLAPLMAEDAGEPSQKHTFHGGTSMLRTHVVHNKKTHFQVYRQWCEAGGITMHPRAIPPSQDLMETQMTLDASLVLRPPAFTKDSLLEYIMELIVTEDKAIQLIDKPAFRCLLQYARPSLTEKDILHCTKLTDTIKA
ncbi:uncharacterized protein F5891DRAFT_1188091 [Suillus fuscotomentosus]|uniref:Uncharacterized protein n=1 Tax=Suillus fuscotomentosus TaxID=1912939 RepID=A0AAD4E7G7_9AGAM|nr:uncharacterized protein F5891DRAFT_1188091 [Suillus fuscotomentosus]KAG1900995.1 hypothetical protein F5891DRAFT_1188091 [Suillus fuscotomentosus]